MFGVEQERLVGALERINAFFCSYTLDGRSSASTRCDCKYGADQLGGFGEAGCGCPETRMALEIVRNLTPFEFDRVTKRAHICVLKETKQ